MTDTITPGDSLKAAIALALSGLSILVVIGLAIAVLVVIRKRTGRPKSSSILVFIGWMFAWSSIQHLFGVRSYEDISWSDFFIQMLVAIALVIFGYRKSELRQQLRSKRAQRDTNDHADGCPVTDVDS